jgi:hypothetical protein
MTQLIHEHSTHIRTPEGLRYVARTYGAPRDEMWIGWIEFYPLGGTGPVLRTETETSQASRAALESWASGVEAAYLEGAFARARVVDDPPPTGRRQTG